MYAPGICRALSKRALGFYVDRRRCDSYRQDMKRFLAAAAALSLLASVPLFAQDAATEERINKLNGQIEELMTAHRTLQKQLSELAQRVDDLREQSGKPNASYLTHEDLKPLADAIREVDRKRIQDAENIQKTLLNIRQLVAQTPTKKPEKAVVKDERPQKGFEYQVQPGDTLSTILQAYREKNVKVTLDQVLKANPGLKPERMKVGETIFIPAP